MTKSHWLLSLVFIVAFNKEAVARPQSDDTIRVLSGQRQALLDRIRQMRPGGTLAGRLIDLDARRNQLVRNYPEGHPDIRLLDQEIAATRAALQKLPELETEYSAINEKIAQANAHQEAMAQESLPLKSPMAWLPRLHYEGQALLAFSGDAKQVDAELQLFRDQTTRHKVNVNFEKVPGRPLQISMRGEGPWSGDVVQQLAAAGQVCVKQSLDEQKAVLSKLQDEIQKKKMDLQTRFNQLDQDRKMLLSGSKRNTPRAQLVAKIEELKTRRRLLIGRYPTHTDIPVLAEQIKELVNQMGRRSAPLSEKVTELDRQINETRVRMDYFSRRLQEAAQASRALKPLWRVIQPIERPKWPNRVENWSLASGVILGLFGLVGWAVFKGKGKARQEIPAHGLWRLEPMAAPVELAVVAPEPSLSTDLLTEKAAVLYNKWIEVAKVLYTPAAEPPQGVLDSVGPLLQESSEFLPEGHDVLARYLARSVTPGDLAAHVARTVLMTLTGAEEAGVSPEHRLAMALAALFHDLAVVPRPTAIQEEVGSEVGRLSASVLRRIPGLQPALLSMVEEILIGMDEFKLETWQNVANGSNLEPLSKVLREIDRFEKIMQKQRARLDRHSALSLKAQSS